jgi:Ni,Fe-hydrogenase I cytochrome b subunit
MQFEFTDAGRILAGIALLSIVTIEVGGWFLTKIVRGDVPMTPFQQAFARAGHAHAGVLVTLGLVGILYADLAQIEGVLGWLARGCVLAAAILMSGGFFASSAGKGRTTPNNAIAMVWIGALSLATGVVSLGVGVLGS